MSTATRTYRDRDQRGSSLRRTVVLSNLAITGFLVGLTYEHVAGNRMAPWIVGRATGICAYLLLDALVVVGLVLAAPRGGRRSGRTPQRLRLHISLALFTTAVIALHVVVLARDQWAGVGWWGALLPFQSHYRPAAVTVGVLAVWIFVLAGITATTAGLLPRRAWWPLHKIALLSFVLVWFHGVLAGSDAATLRALYGVTGIATLAIALWRYKPTHREVAR